MVNPIIRVENGELEGGEAISDNGVKYYYFKGIPYAEPPIQHLRFKDPVPIKPWSGRKNAKKEGNKCMQISMNMLDIAGSEDCLVLNVYTPSLPQKSYDKKHPVMVYIHGGGFKIGSGNSDDFGEEFLVEKDTIVVTMNYRLGVLGFLCLDIPEVPGNAGLKDQTLAMTWVKDNIKFFNGDPENITIFGCSAGSAAVEYQMISPLSEGLFHKAILESGSALNPWARNKNPTQLVQKLKKVLNLNTGDSIDLMKQLQSLDGIELVGAANKITDDDAIKSGELFGFGPVTEKPFKNINGFLTTQPLEILRLGKFLKVPVIIGFCSNEGSVFKMFYGKHLQNLMDGQFADYMMSFNVCDKTKLNSEMKSVYQSSNQSNTDQVDAYLSDLLFVSGIEKSLHYYIHHNAGVYCYLFSYEGNLKIDMPIMKELEAKGAIHGSECMYLCKSPLINESNATQSDKKIRHKMVEMWTNFARLGNPTPEGSTSDLTKWIPISKEKFDVLKIDNEVTMKPFPWPERVKLWQSIGEHE